MNKKILFLFTILFTAFVREGYGQISYKTISPLKTKIESVQKLLGSGKVLGFSKLVYENQDEEAIVSFYQGGCETSVENRLGLYSGLVLEIKIIPKKTQNVTELIRSLYNSNTSNLFSKNLDEDSLIHFDLKDGIIIFSKKILDKEIVESYYFVPSNNISLPKCLINQMDVALKYAFSEDLYLNSERCHLSSDSNIARLYVEEGISSYVFEQLDYLAQNLSACPNFIGKISYYNKKGINPLKISRYLGKLKNYLTKNKNISSERIIFENNGISELSYIDINIITK